MIHEIYIFTVAISKPDHHNGFMTVYELLLKFRHFDRFEGGIYGLKA